MAHYVVDKRYWTSVGGEIASFWGNQRKACDLPKRGLGMTGNSGPLLSRCERHLPNARTFISLPGPSWAGDWSPLNLISSRRSCCHPLSSRPNPLSAAPADFFNTDAVSRACFYLQGDG